MAITINQQPSAYSPAYNENIFLVTSTNTGQANFRYVFDVYASDGTTLIARVKLPARPDDSRCIFDAKRIIENYLSYDLPTINEDAGFYRNSNSFYKYTVKVGEYYGATPTVYADLATASGKYIWNAALSHIDFIGYDQNNYLIRKGVAGGNILSNAPTTQTIEDNQNAHLYMMTNASGSISTARFKKYNSAGVQLGSDLDISNTYFDATADNERFIRLATGTKNLNEHTASWIDGDVSYYTVQILDNTGTPVVVSDVYRYNILTNCRYETVRLHFLNTLGGFDSYGFSLKSNERNSVSRSTYKKEYGSTSGTSWSYGASERGSTVFFTDTNKTFIANSDWLTEDESAWLSELIESPEVYREHNGMFLPVEILNSEYEPKKKENQRLFNLQISFKYSNNDYKQRA